MPPKKSDTTKADRLEQLIERLEDRLTILCEPELKKTCLKHLIAIKNSMTDLDDQFTELFELLGCTYQDINYPDVK